MPSKGFPQSLRQTYQSVQAYLLAFGLLWSCSWKCSLIINKRIPWNPDVPVNVSCLFMHANCLQVKVNIYSSLLLLIIIITIILVRFVNIISENTKLYAEGRLIQPFRIVFECKQTHSSGLGIPVWNLPLKWSSKPRGVESEVWSPVHYSQGCFRAGPKSPPMPVLESIRACSEVHQLDIY